MAETVSRSPSAGTAANGAAAQPAPPAPSAVPPAAAPAEGEWHRSTPDQVAAKLGVDVQKGLTTAQAQERLGGEPPGRSGLPSLPTLEDQPSKPPEGPILPPLPPPAPAERQRLPQQVRVFVRQIRVEGNTVFPSEKLEEITRRYVDRELTTEDLEALRLDLTRLYVDAGYINSGAVIPDQTVSEGVITYQIIEGQLTDIEVSGTRWFRESYIRKRLALGAGPTLNILPLQERLQFLQQDERIVRLDAELKPGTQRGEGTLSVHVEEANPFKVEFAFNNYQSPTVGAARELITLTHQNLTGHGDPLSVTYEHSEGLHVLLDASYFVPLTIYDTTLGVRYRRNIFTVIQEQLTFPLCCFDQLSCCFPKRIV